MIDRHDLHDDEATETLLRASLDRAGRPAPFSVDVADTVMARVAGLGPAPRTEMEWPQFVRWAIAASIVGLGLLVAAAWHGPSLDQLAIDLGRTTADTAGTAAELSRPAETLAHLVARSAVNLWDAARSVARPLDALRPLAQLSLAVVTIGMVGFSAIVIGRDLRLVAHRKEQA